MATFKLTVTVGAETLVNRDVEAGSVGEAFTAAKAEGERLRAGRAVRVEVRSVDGRGLSCHLYDHPSQLTRITRESVGGPVEVAPEAFHGLRSAGIEDQPH
jgi:hypothetical protein